MKTIGIIPYTPDRRSDVLDLTVEAWTGVLDKTAQEVPGFVYKAFYPNGWQARQRADVGALLDAEPQAFHLAMDGETVVGFVGIRLHPEDRMGEVVIIAVAPSYRRRGVARQLMQFAEDVIKASGMEMVMVETVGDSGHLPARKTYESLGFQPWPVARYFKQL